MELYKESLLNKIEDDLTGRNQNWDAIETHLADYDAHVAESAQKHITESGENANGNYIRFDDGTQICFRTANISFNTTSAQHFEYPATFTKVIGGGWGVNSPSGGASSADVHRMLSKEFPGVELSSSGWIIWFRYSTQLVDATRLFYLFAIGRWK